MSNARKPCVTYFYSAADGTRSHEVFVFDHEAERDVWVEEVQSAWPTVELHLSLTSAAAAVLAAARTQNSSKPRERV